MVAFNNVTRLTHEMFRDVVERLMRRLQKKHSLAVRLKWQSDTGTWPWGTAMFYLPHNTVSVLVRDV